MSKLKIRIFGVCLAAPLAEETKPVTVEKMTVLTPQSPRAQLASDGKTQIDALYTYLMVPSINVPDESKRRPDHLLNGEAFAAFMLHREEIRVATGDTSGVVLPYGEPTFPNNPSPASTDPRWICNLPSLLSGASLRKGALDPAAGKVPPAVGARLVSYSGQFTGEFPCGNKGPTKIHHANIERHFAQEMALTVDLPGDEATFESTPFGGGSVPPIKLRAAGGADFVAYFVCAPLITMDDLAKGFDNPCVVTNDHHHQAEVDFEFEVLWNLLDLPRATKLPVPGLVQEQGSRVDCIPGAA